MLTIRITTIREKEHPVLQIDDELSCCCSEILRDLEDTPLKGNMLILVEFSPGIKPSIAAIVVGFLAARYETVAISEKDWDLFIVAASNNGNFPVGNEIS